MSKFTHELQMFYDFDGIECVQYEHVIMMENWVRMIEGVIKSSILYFSKCKYFLPIFQKKKNIEYEALENSEEFAGICNHSRILSELSRR
jgi:hypothetical protein